MIETIIFILILSFLVFIHELGHYIAAKRSGVIVEEFSIGYPPRALKLFEWDGTEFTLSWIPFGGFVRMAGEEAAYEDPGEDEKEKKSDKGKFFAATKMQKMIIILAGAAVNFVFGIIAFTLVFSQMGVPEPISTPRIGVVMPESPAAEAGIPENVEIQEITIENQTFVADSVEKVTEIINQNKGKSAVISTTGLCEGYSCEESLNNYQVYFRTDEEIPANEGSLGIIFQQVAFVHYPWWQMPYRSAYYGIQQALYLGEQIIAALGNMTQNLVSKGEVPSDLAGPVGIVDQAKTAGIFSEGFLTIISFTGMLSVNLAIMNILPIPPLDGGRAVFILLEGAVPKRYSKTLEYYLNYGGYFLFILLIIFITARDIWRLFE